MPPKVIGEKLKGRYQNSMHAPRRASELNSIDVISEGTDYSRYPTFTSSELRISVHGAMRYSNQILRKHFGQDIHRHSES